jgi:DNA polymerase-3 subunit delta'
VTTAAADTDLWADAVGQDHAASQLRRAAATPVHAYLFLGQEGWGARAVATAFAADVLSNGLDAAATERVRHLCRDSNFADLLVVEPEGNTLRNEEVDELIRLAFRSPTEGPRKVLVLPRFDTAGPTAWSRMLKVLEEPPRSTVWVLLADDLPPEMATISSRSSVVRLEPVPDGLVARRLVAEGNPEAAAAIAAGAAGGDLGLARLLVGDERLGNRVDHWRRIPDELDGSGYAAWRLTAEVRSAIDEGLAVLKAHFDEIEADLTQRAQELGLPKSRLRDQQASHKRQLRRARTAELRMGLAAMAGRYRDAVADGPDRPVADRRRLLGAVEVIDAAYEALAVRNANESLQLQALLLRLPSLR